MAIAAFALAVPVQAENWKYYGDSDTFVGSIDIDSVRSSGTTVRAWQRRMYSKPQTGPFGTYVEVRVLHEVYCSDQSMKMLSWAAYGSNGDVVQSRSIPSYDQELSYVVPGTVGESFFKAACSN